MDSFYLTDAIRQAVDSGIPAEEMTPPLNSFEVAAYVNYKREKALGPDKVREIDAERSKRSARNWNYIINCVNGREKPTIQLTESEQFDYECMAEEKEIFEKLQRSAVERGEIKRACPLIFENAETEW